MKKKKEVIISKTEYDANHSKYFDMAVKDRMNVKVVDDKGIILQISGGPPRFRRTVEHQFQTHREDPYELARLRNYYLGLGRKGHLGTIHALIEFIEAYAEEMGWDLDEYSPK